MSKFNDIIGQKFGRLTVVERMNNDKHGNVTWRCICDCSNETIIPTNSLKSGNTKSCGCYNNELCSRLNKKSFGESSINKILDGYIRGAKRRNIEFTLSTNEFKKLLLSNCFYCKKLPSQQWNDKYKNGNIIYNGIDRIDNLRGYVIDNVVSSCFQCNHAKGRCTEVEFYTWVKSIYENLNLDKYN